MSVTEDRVQRRSLIMVEQVPDGADALEIDGSFRVFLKVFAKSYHEVVNGSCGGFSCVSPDDLE